MGSYLFQRTQPQPHSYTVQQEFKANLHFNLLPLIQHYSKKWKWELKPPQSWRKFWWGLILCDINTLNCYYKVMYDCVSCFTYFSINYHALRLRQLSWRCHTYCCTKKDGNSRCPCWTFWFLSVHTWTDLLQESSLPACFILKTAPYCVFVIISFCTIMHYFSSRMVSKREAMCWQEFKSGKVKERETSE